VKARAVLVIETVSIVRKSAITVPSDRSPQFASNRKALTAIPPPRKKTRFAAEGSKSRHSNAQGGAFLCGANASSNLRQPRNPLISLVKSLGPSWHAFCILGNIDRH
jgi:hypothetical protein